MAKGRIILVPLACLLVAILAVETLSQSSNPNRSAGPPDPARLRRSAEQGRAEARKRIAELRAEHNLQQKSGRKEKYHWEKIALGVTEEQWNIIKPKLEKIEQLRRQAYVGGNLSLTVSSTNGSKDRKGTNDSRPQPRWGRKWENKDPGELTEGERLVDGIIALLESRNPKSEDFKEKMNALRKSKEKPREEFAKAIQELRKELTVRQEAALMLMHWLRNKGGSD